jgi:hypothetical protein
MRSQLQYVFVYSKIVVKYFIKVWNNIKDKFSPTDSKGNPYSVPPYVSARGHTTTGYKFTAASTAAGNDQYTNDYTVEFVNDPTHSKVEEFTGRKRILLLTLCTQGDVTIQWDNLLLQKIYPK